MSHPGNLAGHSYAYSPSRKLAWHEQLIFALLFLFVVVPIMATIWIWGPIAFRKESK